MSEDQAKQDLLVEGFQTAERKLKHVAETSHSAKEFNRGLNLLQIEATHTLALLILNSWLLNDQKDSLHNLYRMTASGIEEDLKALGEAHAEGKLDTAEVKLKAKLGGQDGEA